MKQLLILSGKGGTGKNDDGGGFYRFCKRAGFCGLRRGCPESALAAAICR